MTKYVIKSHYSTGDSYNTYDTSTTLAAVWTDLNEAKVALKWLTEQHKYYDAVENSHRWGEKVDVSDLETKPWFRPGKNFGMPHWMFSCNVHVDNAIFVVDIPYHGYFEHLQTLEIIIEEPDTCDWRVDF